MLAPMRRTTLSWCLSCSQIIRMCCRWSCVVYAESVKSCVVSITDSRAAMRRDSVFVPTNVTRTTSTTSCSGTQVFDCMTINFAYSLFRYFYRRFQHCNGAVVNSNNNYMHGKAQRTARQAQMHLQNSGVTGPNLIKFLSDKEVSLVVLTCASML